MPLILKHSASHADSSLQKYFPKNGWAISNGAKHTFHTPEGGATSKPIVAPERLSRVDDTPSDSQYAVPDVVEDFVPIKLATSDDTRATAADTALRSATTLQDSDSRARPLKDSDEDSSLSVMQEVCITLNVFVLPLWHRILFTTVLLVQSHSPGEGRILLTACLANPVL